MKRDFSTSTLSQLLGYLDEVDNSELWAVLSDWIWDGLYYIKHLFVKAPAAVAPKEELERYYREVIDKKNACAEEIKEIFLEAQELDRNYADKAKEINDYAERLLAEIKKLSSVAASGKVENIYYLGKQNISRTSLFPEAAALATSAASVATKKKSTTKTTFTEGTEWKDTAKDLYLDTVDTYREKTGRTGEMTSKEQTVYSSKKSGSVSVLGTPFAYQRYVDYRGLQYGETTGDSFYAASGALDMTGIYCTYEATDGSALSGNYELNSMHVYGKADLDLAKGNAYACGGVDYTVASTSIKLGDESMSVSLTGEVGVGTRLNAGIHNGKLTVEVSAALGIGVGAGFEIDYKKAWDEICDSFTFKGW